MKFYNSLLVIAVLAMVVASGRDRIGDAADAARPAWDFLLRAPRVKPAIWAAWRAPIGLAKLWQPPRGKGTRRGARIRAWSAILPTAISLPMRAIESATSPGSTPTA